MPTRGVVGWLAVLALALGVASAGGCGSGGTPSPGTTGATASGGAGGATGGGAIGGAATGGAATGGDASGGSESGGSGPVVCDLGTKYPESPVINPDDPDYEDADYTKEATIQAFAEDKAKNGQAYRAYKAAYLYGPLLECAFCSCGCSAPSLGHLSAIDCFKDMHGFT